MVVTRGWSGRWVTEGRKKQKKGRKEENKKEGREVVDCQGLGEEVWGVTVLQDEKSSEEGWWWWLQDHI